MMRLCRALLALAFISLAATGAHSYWQSRSQVSVGAAAYAGPGNVVSGATMWYGLRAYSLAQAGTNAVRLVRASDSIETNIVILADGSLDVATATTFCAATTCKAVTLFDQSGALSCGGAVCDVTQATDSNRPAFTFNCIGSLPCLTFTTATVQLARANPAITSPWSIAWVAQRTSNFTTTQGVVGGYNGATALGLGFRNFASSINLSFPTSINLAATDSVWHAAQGVANTGANAIYLDGTTSITGQAGTADNWVVNRIVLGASVFNTNGMINGLFTEAGVWGSKAFDATEANNLAANAKTYWGF